MVFHRNEDGFTEQAEEIIDRFLEEQGPDDLLKLQESIATALRSAFKRGQQKRNCIKG